MLKNYLRIAYRSLLKNKAFSFINIVGLSVGMAAFLSIVHYVRFERSYEGYNPNANNVYRITLDIYKGSEYVVTDCETHPLMGPILKEKMPEVKDFARLFDTDGSQLVKVENKEFLETGIYFADPSIFNMFSLKVIAGNPNQALSEVFQVVLSESVAKKYFGKTDVVGKSLEIFRHVFQVTSVVADSPNNTHLKFNMLLSHTSLPRINTWYKEDSWDGNNEYTYLLMTSGADLNAFNKKLADLCVALKDKLENNKYVAEPIKNIHLYSNKTFEPEVNGNAKVVFFLLIISGFIILIAWVNYINLSTARAVERAREVGIRKVMGSVKSQLVFQFLSESIIVNLVAGILAFGLFQTMLPLFRNLTGQPLPLNFIADPQFWYLFVGLIVVGSMLSGIYPAFVLSSFQPVAVLKGKFRSSSHGQLLRKGLVVFQFGTTVVLLIGMLTVYLQINYMRHADLGMNIDQTLVIRAPLLSVSDSTRKSFYQSLKTELLRVPDVQKLSRSETLPGLNIQELNTTSFTRVGQEKQNNGYEYYLYSVDDDFIPALNMKLAAGRNFDSKASNKYEVIINEEAVKRLGFSNAEEAIGSKITYWSGATIIGVVKNFYQRSPKEKHIPMLLRYSEDANYFSLNVKTKDIHETLASLKITWNRVLPNSLFSYFFLNDKFNQQYQADAQFGQVVATFSGLAIFIACLGLFGLSSYTIVQRTKEIGIRKVLGASVTQIVGLLSQDFIKVVMIAALVALPVAYWAMNEWLSNYEVRINLNAWVFIIPVMMILLLALVTVSFQTFKTAISNPTDSLKQE
jgi:putative ABC transport system permease protein